MSNRTFWTMAKTFDETDVIQVSNYNWMIKGGRVEMKDCTNKVKRCEVAIGLGRINGK